MEILSLDLTRNLSAAESVAGNEDLLTDILLRLPVKSILRFKSVSNQWLSLITNPHFSRRHTLRHRRSSLSGIFLRRTSSGLTNTEFDFVSISADGNVSAPYGSLNFADDDIKILQSCNGLFLCSNSHKIGTTRKYYIYNPSTHRFLPLPPPGCGGSETVFGVNSAFEPLKSAHYEVVMVRSTAASVYSYQIEIYSSETRAWRPCGEPFAAPFDIVFDNGVFWNGAIHWLSPTGASLYFNISNSSVKEIPRIPVTGNLRKRSFRYFGECSGHLHLVEAYGPQATKLNIFELERDYSKWVVKYQVDLEVVATAFPEMVREHLGPCDSIYYSFIVFYVAREENDGECSLLLHIPGKVVSYKVEYMVSEKVCDVETLQSKTETKLQFGWIDVHPFVESMACV